MRHYHLYTSVLLCAIALSCCCCGRAEDPYVSFEKDVYAISNDIRDVTCGTFKGKTRISVYVYSTSFTEDYEGLCDTTEGIASGYNLDENDSYYITIYDINKSIQDLESAEHEYDYVEEYYGEYSKEYQ